MFQKHTDTVVFLHTQTLMKQWLTLRQTVLIQYNELCLKAHQSPSKRLELFAQNLMDYISMGHFQMFEKLAEHHEKEAGYSKGLNKNLLAKITTTTDAILEFNEQYTNPQHLDNLINDLSILGESLANRMDLEDTLIKSAAPRYIKQ